MSIMNLSVSSIAFSINGIAGIDLIVSVTHYDGKLYTGLTNISTFYIAAGNRSDQGQIVYMVEDPSIALP
jgi:hypothetical protein